jgi:hypothetical protein
LTTIAYQDLTDDFFINEIKPDSIQEGRVVFSATGKEPTINIIERQVCPVRKFVKDQNWTEAVAHARGVCREMNGFLGFAQKDSTQESACKHVEAIARAGGMSFDAAVAAVIVVTYADGHGNLKSAASKMLQLFPAFSNDSVIYDSVVRETLKARNGATKKQTEDISYYFPHVRQLLAAPLVSMPDGSLISVNAYFERPEIKQLVANSAWVASHGLEGFVRSRLLDRVLWLIAAEPREEKVSKKQLKDQKAAAQAGALQS